MGKRRDKTGRRQILQLNDEVPPVNLQRNSLHGLMQYNDSDEEETKAQNEVVPADDGKPESARKIDLEVLDFLKEIDALQPTVDSPDGCKEPDRLEDSPTTSSPPHKDSSPRNDLQSDKNFEKSESPEIQSTLKEIESFYESHSPSTNNLDEVCSSGFNNNGGYTAWQQCYDEGSGYTYFWNMETNEVTWECPPDYNSQAQEIHMSMAAMANDAFHAQLLDKSGNSKKQVNRLREEMNEGKITPITYFEPSFSSEDSSEEEIVQRKKLKHKSTKLRKTVSKKVAKTIGPQLLQGHALPKNVVKKTAMHSEEMVIGPQLPSYYIPRETKSKEEASTSTSNERDTEILKSRLQMAKSSVQPPPPPPLQSLDCTALSLVDGPSTSNSVFANSSASTNPEKSNGQEPDSTTRKDNSSDGRKTMLNNRVKSSLKRTLQTLVHYAESGSEDEIDEKTEKMPVFNADKYRRDGRQGFGFKDISNHNNWQKKNESFVEKDNSKISFIKSKEILDLNKLNKQEMNGMEEKIKRITPMNGDVKTGMDVSSCSTATISGESSSSRLEDGDLLSKRLKSEDAAEIQSKSQDTDHLEMLSNIMMEKLTFLTIAQGEISSLCNLLIQLQTRHTDWKENALSPSYFLTRLKETQDVLRQYEMNAMPSGWICDWDRGDIQNEHSNASLCNKVNAWSFIAHDQASHLMNREDNGRRFWES